jgi:prepilin-type N-terminal cleavage/methylation domain-containing protein
MQLKFRRNKCIYKIYYLNKGFTLIEMSIVMVIIGALLAGVLSARTIIRNSQTKDLIKSVNDFAAGVVIFKEKYAMWPGDYSSAVANIAGLTCPNGNANGQVNSNAESNCATESLIRVGILRGVAGQAITIRGSTILSFTGGTNILTGVPVARLPNNAINVIRVQNIDCDSALQLDRAVDDGNVDTGNFRTDAVCISQDENVAIANAVLKVN